jgi:hypothetical protein
MFDKIKSLFVITEEDPNAPKKEAISSTATGGNPVANNPNTKPSQESNPADAVADLTDRLLKAIEASNQQGFDYLEFKNSLKSIEKVIPDEATRFKSAFEMGKTMGLTKDTLISSADAYLAVLAEENNKFKVAVENQKAIKIQERGDQFQTLEKAIQDKKSQIQKLQAEIEETTKQLDLVKKEIEESSDKIELRNKQFNASYKLVYDQIANDVSKIKQHI